VSFRDGGGAVVVVAVVLELSWLGVQLETISRMHKGAKTLIRRFIGFPLDEFMKAD
jgi:hypothetical protein